LSTHISFLAIQPTNIPVRCHLFIEEQLRRDLFLSMPIEVAQMERQFAFGGRIIPDPNSELTPEAVREFLTFQYPEMSTATIVGPETAGRYLRYTIQRSIGSKG
jgi:PRTRC genetic system protein C